MFNVGVNEVFKYDSISHSLPFKPILMHVFLLPVEMDTRNQLDELLMNIIITDRLLNNTKHICYFYTSSSL